MYKRIANVFGLSFSSGLPFVLILSSLNLWLVELGKSKAVIGIFAMVSLPYGFKFLFAPILDKVRIPFFSNYFGNRQAWIIISQILLFILINLLGLFGPNVNIYAAFVIALLIGITSAIQDLSIEAYRVENLNHKYIGMAISASVLGHKLGMFIAGAGSLLVAEFYGWAQAYHLISFSILPGMISTYFARDESAKRIKKQTFQGAGFKFNIIYNIKKFLVHREWKTIIPFIIFLKVTDAILVTMSMSFFTEIGFTKLELAYVSKTFGIGAMVVGSSLGGVLLLRHNLYRVLYIAAILQLLASILFLLQTFIGHNINFLFVTVGIENLASGVSQVALITYISKLCSQPNTAMHYAILSSIGSVSRVLSSLIGGFIADYIWWTDFYCLTLLTAIPSILILAIKNKHFHKISLDPSSMIDDKPNLVHSRL